MNKVTIIATSLSENSKSQFIARAAEAELSRRGITSELFDLRELDLPLAGSNASWGSEDANRLSAAVESSSHVLFAVPVYCYDVNATAKNVIELIGRSFTKKIIAFACSAGGVFSYMSVMGMANHMMLDFRSVIVPRFLYVDPSGWEEDQLTPEIENRLKRLIQDMQEIHLTDS